MSVAIMKFTPVLTTIWSSLACDIEKRGEVGFEYMTNKIWEDWGEIGEALSWGRKLAWGLLFALLGIIIFFPIMA